MENSFNLALRNLKKNGLEARRVRGACRYEKGCPETNIYYFPAKVIKEQEVPLINILFEAPCCLHDA